ncbi:MAG TPA: glycosyltransferase family 4 protein [Sphingomicrobium sp.]|jgi:glycosyltransferase involved in cell wall biosynthesis|nr:glycosyltransferase family 4 protein [Sphingomicrobium sp.]
MQRGRLRVLALPRYGRLGASSRMRFWQYLPWLEAAGIEVEVRPLLPDSYVARLQAGRRDVTGLALGYARQIAGLLRLGDYDLLWIEKELLLWVPGRIERALLPRDVPRVLDYDDAVYDLYEMHRLPIVRRLLQSKHPAAMRHASLVVAGSAAIAERARKAGAARVEVVPTVVDLDRYSARRQRDVGDGPARVCWIGQQSTSVYLRPYSRLFEDLSASGHARFAAIGIDASAQGFPMESLPWSEESEVATISSCDIGIMPLADGPFERGKCGYKLIQYMACGLPVVASPVGSNREIVEHGVTGFLADTEDEWREALMALANDPALRACMGAKGRKRVEEHYSIQKTGPAMAQLLRSAVDAGVAR